MGEVIGGQAEVFTPVHHIAADPQHIEDTDTAPRTPRRVGVIDDQEMMRSLLRTMVEGSGHVVVEATSLEDGLRLIRAEGREKIDAVITDLSLGTEPAGVEREFHTREGLLLLRAAREHGIVDRGLYSGTVTHEVASHPHAEGATIMKKPNFQPVLDFIARL